MSDIINPRATTVKNNYLSTNWLSEYLIAKNNRKFINIDINWWLRSVFIRCFAIRSFIVLSFKPSPKHHFEQQFNYNPERDLINFNLMKINSPENKFLSETLYCFLIIQGYNELYTGSTWRKEVEVSSRARKLFFLRSLFDFPLLVSIAISLMIIFYFWAATQRN
jgi:hypothetical protein